MGRLLIVKAGVKLPALHHVAGDFEDWIVAGMALSRAQVAEVCTGAALPDYADVDGVVITGSAAMVTDHTDWIERTATWLSGAVERRIPVLGICFGHQLLAYALGGKVADNPQGVEVGTVMAQRMRAVDDPLLGGLAAHFPAQTSHRQTVLTLPAEAVRLAASELDANLAFAVDGCAWGVQFHPEFSPEVVKHYITYYHPALRAQGRDPECLQSTCTDTPEASGVLARFAALL